MKKNEKKSFSSSPPAINIQRRKHGRIRVNMNGYFVINQKKYETVFLNIGTGGLALLSNTPLSKGEIIKIFFDIENEKIMVEGRISREAGKIFAIKFENISQKDVDTIQKFINSQVYGNDNK